MEATRRPMPDGLPRSPTLSEISMILPDGDKLRSVSPVLYFERPPSPPSFYTHSNRSARTIHTIRLASVPEGRREPSLKIGSPPLSAQSSRSTLRNMGNSEVAAKVPFAYDDALASSPTVDDSLLRAQITDLQPRRLSNGSSSTMNSDDLEDMRKRWPGFDSHPGVDDSGVDLEDEEEKNQSPVDATGETDNEPWLNERSDSDDNTYSSDLYSKRAELILANAKKRLNVMEGNLRGARQSLVVSPTLNSSKMSSELSHQVSAARERDRRLYAGLGPIPPRSRAYHPSNLSSNSPSHSRGLSETSVPLPFSSPSYMNRTLSKRASSAMGQASGPWSPEGYGTGRFPIRESRSFEVMRERSNGLWHDDRDHSLRSHSRGSRSPPNILETLPEDGSPKLHRSASTTSSLRDQMDDLKGRISSLKQRAKEDHLRRRSLQSLRAPSPFTSAETWYSGTEAYQNGGSPIAADAGVGVATQSPTRKALFEEDEESGMTPSKAADGSPVDPYGAVKAADYGHGPSKTDNYQDPPAYHYGNHFTASKEYNNIQGFEEDDEDEPDFVSMQGDDVDAGGSSIYEDAVYEMPATERHEDRVDAFDYENFFLHSAMGTYSQVRRGSGSSDDSADSVATTRPATAIQAQEDDTGAKRVSYHQRNYSADSVSTMASFATAAEEQWDDEEENERMDQFSQQILPTNHSITPRLTQDSPRSDSAINMRKANVSPSQTSQTSRGSSPAGDLKNGLQTSKIFSIMLETPREEPRLALSEEEKQLIYSLSSSFQQVCTNLQSTAGDQYERKEWRRRLDEARRILNGEEFEGQPF